MLSRVKSQSSKFTTTVLYYSSYVCSENITPVIVVDKSNYPASSIIREKLAAAKSAGLDANAVVFNEIS